MAGTLVPRRLVRIPQLIAATGGRSPPKCSESPEEFLEKYCIITEPEPDFIRVGTICATDSVHYHTSPRWPSQARRGSFLSHSWPLMQ